MTMAFAERHRELAGTLVGAGLVPLQARLPGAPEADVELTRSAPSSVNKALRKPHTPLTRRPHAVLGAMDAPRRPTASQEDPANDAER